MIITPLGHTEFLVDIAGDEGRNLRILVDAWLSDYAVGDMMERTVKMRIDAEKIETIDAIYISHSHTDHLDPYTLVEIYGGFTPLIKGGRGDLVPEESEQNPQSLRDNSFGKELIKPILLLPFTLEYLVPLFREYLGDIDIRILGNKQPLTLSGVEITGYMFPQSDITNEDDVMMLAIANSHELLFAEIDTLPDDTDPDTAKALYRLFTRREYETRSYIASRNVLEAALPVLDLPSEKREGYRREFIAGEKEKMTFSYEKYEYEEFMDFPRLYDLPGFVRGFIGQGITYPHSLSSELAEYEIFSLPEIASMESDIARAHGYEFAQKALLPGRQYYLEDGQIEQGRKECPIGVLENSGREDEGKGRIYASGPLFPRALSDDQLREAREKILETLNTKFLPYWSASSVASLRDALIRNNGTYTISFSLSSRRDPFQNHVGENNNQNPLSEGKRDSFVSLRNDKKEEIIFQYSVFSGRFQEVTFREGMHIDESYHLLDVLDFLEGRQDLYSNFWHTLDPKMVYRLWTCLGANFCNNDIVLSKYRLHFECAKEGLTANDFVEGVLAHIRNP